MALTKQEKAQIKSIQGDDRWNAVLKFVGLKLTQWRESGVSGRTSFEELRALHKRDGKVEGVLEVFEQMERQAFED